MYSANYFSQMAGIIGGVGPEATNYFTSLLVKLKKKVKKDQDHIPYLLFNNPQIPDRSNYLLNGGVDPIPDFIHTGLQLKKAGATFLVIPCNTAHAFTDELEKRIRLPIMNMIDLTVKYIADTYGTDVTIGLLATTGTIKSNVYQKVCQKMAPNMKLLVPTKKTQTEVMRACYDIKKYSADETSFTMLSNAAHELLQQGASVIILGCTEIPLALTAKNCDFDRVDPMEILARQVIKKTLESKLTMPGSVVNVIRSQYPTQISLFPTNPFKRP